MSVFFFYQGLIYQVCYKRLVQANIFYVGNHNLKAKNYCPRPSTTFESAVTLDPITPPSSSQSTAILEAIWEKKP